MFWSQAAKIFTAHIWLTFWTGVKERLFAISRWQLMNVELGMCLVIIRSRIQGKQLSIVEQMCVVYTLVISDICCCFVSVPLLKPQLRSIRKKCSFWQTHGRFFSHAPIDLDVYEFRSLGWAVMKSRTMSFFSHPKYTLYETWNHLLCRFILCKKWAKMVFG